MTKLTKYHRGAPATLQQDKRPSLYTDDTLTDEQVDRLRALQAHTRSPATMRAYEKNWRSFVTWAANVGRLPFPASPATVGLWIDDHLESAVSSVSVMLAAIRAVHEAAGKASPTLHPDIRALRKAHRNLRGTKPKQKAPLLVELLVKILPQGRSLRDLRDKAVLLFGYAGAFRRSELAALDIGDVAWHEDRILVTIRRSKTDQSGEGHTIAIIRGGNPKTCPVTALRDWLQALADHVSRVPLREDPSALFHGFRGDAVGPRLAAEGVAAIVKRRAKLAGLDPHQFAGHSLRAGFATQAAINDVDALEIARQTRHKNLETLRGYVRIGELFRDDVSGKVGL